MDKSSAQDAEVKLVFCVAVVRLETVGISFLPLPPPRDADKDVLTTSLQLEISPEEIRCEGGFSGFDGLLVGWGSLVDQANLGRLVFDDELKGDHSWMLKLGVNA